LASGETNTVTFQYPPGWQLTQAESRFDSYDFQFREPFTLSLIQVSSGMIKSEFLQENPELYFNSFLNGTTSEMIRATIVESYMAR
jgi:hypothetical protein